MNEIFLKPGDTLKHDGTLHVVIRANDSGATIAPVDNKMVRKHIATSVDQATLLERHGGKWLLEFLTTKATRRPESQISGENQNESENSMSKTKLPARGGLAAQVAAAKQKSQKAALTPEEKAAKKAEKDAAKQAAKQSKAEKKAAANLANKEAKAAKKAAKKAGKKSSSGGAAGSLGKIHGFSIGSILNRLGKEGVKAEEARRIMQGQKLDIKNQTVAWNINEGKGGRGKAAELTKDQLKELITSAVAPEPSPEAKAA